MFSVTPSYGGWQNGIARLSSSSGHAPQHIMIIFGIEFWAWGSALTQRIWNCSKCGFEGQFIEKKGMRFITLYWVIPTIPVSGVTRLVQCPKCKTRYQDNNPNSSAPPPLADPWA